MLAELLRKTVALTLAVLHNVSAGVIDVMTYRGADYITHDYRKLCPSRLCSHQGLIDLPPQLSFLEIIAATRAVGKSPSNVAHRLAAIHGRPKPEKFAVLLALATTDRALSARDDEDRVPIICAQ